MGPLEIDEKIPDAPPDALDVASEELVPPDATGAAVATIGVAAGPVLLGVPSDNST